MNVNQFRRNLVDEYKISKGCEICGYNKHSCALSFDHLPGHEKAEICKNGATDADPSKTIRGGGMWMFYQKKYPVEHLIEEIKKCRILCMNCHMEHTYSKTGLRGKNLGGMTFDELEKRLRGTLIVCKPISNFVPESNDPTDTNGAVWAQVLDKRFCAEVVRTKPYEGELRIFDSNNNYALLHRRDVIISYDAIFGPDVSDCYVWRTNVLDFVDNQMENQNAEKST